jgi:hypothetical protein
MNYFFGGIGSSIPSSATAVPGSIILIGVIRFWVFVSSGLSAVQEEVKRIAAKQLKAIHRFFIKK